MPISVIIFLFLLFLVAVLVSGRFVWTCINLLKEGYQGLTKQERMILFWQQIGLLPWISIIVMFVLSLVGITRRSDIVYIFPILSMGLGYIGISSIKNNISILQGRGLSEDYREDTVTKGTIAIIGAIVGILPVLLSVIYEFL